MCVCECPFENTKQARKLLHKTSLHAAKTLNLALGFQRKTTMKSYKNRKGRERSHCILRNQKSRVWERAQNSTDVVKLHREGDHLQMIRLHIEHRFNLQHIADDAYAPHVGEEADLVERYDFGRRKFSCSEHDLTGREWGESRQMKAKARSSLLTCSFLLGS